MEVVVFYGIYLFAALLLAGTAIVVTGGALHLGYRTNDGLLVYILLPLIVVIALDPILSGRNLSFDVSALVAAGESRSAVVKWLQRLTSLYLLAAAVERVAYKLFKGGRTAGHGPLMIAFAVCWIGNVALPCAFGDRPVFTHEYMYWFVIGLGLLATSATGAETAIRVARNALAVFSALGLIILVVKSSMVLQPYVGGLFKFFPWRYSGLAVGPNQMGPFALLLMICLACFPFERRWLNRAAWFAAWMSILLSQSKTAWLAGLASFTVIGLVRGKGLWATWLRSPRHRFAAQCLFVVAALLLVLGMLVVGSGALEAKLQKFLATRAGTDMANLTGRNEIWAAAWQTFVDHPWFGYGPTIWDPYFQFKIGLNVFHAHSQILNVMAASGLVGLVSFLVFVVMLYRQAWKHITAYNGFVAGVGVVVLLRFISEVPFTFHSFGTEALMPSLLFLAIAGASSAQRHMAASASQA
jgi:O-antigen ligase